MVSVKKTEESTKVCDKSKVNHIFELFEWLVKQICGIIRILMRPTENQCQMKQMNGYSNFENVYFSFTS